MTQVCSSCSKPKANHTCRNCEAKLCKACVEYVDSERFGFLEEKESEALVGAYCRSCFQSKVAGEEQKYDEMMEQAKNVSVYFTEQGKETRLIKRSLSIFKVEDCPDKDEAVLRLAFKAAREGFDTLVDVELTYEKVRDGSFKLASWKGRGTAAKPDPKHLPAPKSNRRSPSR